MREFNDDKTKAITDEYSVFAIVGYAGSVEDGVFEGTHAGCFSTYEKAKAWLDGDGKPDLMMEYSIEA